jgi:glucokinase
LVDKEGIIHLRGKIDTSLNLSPEELIRVISSEIKSAVKSLSDQVVLKGVGIGAPNGNYFTGSVKFAPNMNWKEEVKVTKLFYKSLGVKAVLTNDANAAALGEMLFGKAKNVNDFLFITLGTGLGSGIVANGQLIYGHDGFAGELGHVVINQNGRKCGCGRFGCLETYASATGIKKTYQELLMANNTLSEFNPDIHGSHFIYDRAIHGEKEAIEAFDYTARMLAFELANSVAYTSPEVIYLFGGLSQAGELLLRPLRAYFEEGLLNIYQNKIAIEISGLPHNDAAILGAASLIWKEDLT